MKILGIDPGTGRLGWGMIEQTKGRLIPLEFGLIETPALSERGSRLLTIHRNLRKIVRRLQPDLIAVELLFFARNVTTAMAVSEARGVVLLSAAEAKIPVVAYSPMSVKSALGMTTAKKKDVKRLVNRLLRSRKKFKTDDVADALAVAICAAINLNRKAATLKKTKKDARATPKHHHRRVGRHRARAG